MDVPKWRNWQTQQTQNLPYANTCRFESGLRHHSKIKASGDSGSLFFLYAKRNSNAKVMPSGFFVTKIIHAIPKYL